MNNYFKRKKDGSLPNVRSRSTLNDPMREKFNQTGRKRNDLGLNRTRDQSQKMQSLPAVKSKRALKEHAQIKGNKSGHRHKEKKKQQKSKSPRPRLPERYTISPSRSPQAKSVSKAEKKENRVQPTNFNSHLNNSAEIDVNDSNSSIQVERLGSHEGMQALKMLTTQEEYPSAFEQTNKMEANQR